jgi:hypothetical protein
MYFRTIAAAVAAMVSLALPSELRAAGQLLVSDGAQAAFDTPSLPGNWPRNPYTTKPKEWPDGPNKEFLKNLMRPDNHKHPYRDKHSLSCCDAGDTVKTKFKVEEGNERYPEDRWYAWLKDEWVPIPPEKIVQDYAPDGQPYLFLLADTIQCFVRPKGGL